MQQFRNFLATYWQPALLYGLLIAGCGGLLWWKLGSLVGGYSPSEAIALQASTNWRHIFENPINAPFTLVAHALQYLGEHSLFLMRATATIFGLATLTVFYWLVRHWHGERAAIFGTILFGCSAWFLHTARLGTPDVALFGLLALAAGTVWIKRTDNRFVLFLLFLFAAGLLYVPGMIWFIALGVIWQWKAIDRIFRRHLGVVTLGAFGLLAVLAPLGRAIYKSPETAKVIAGLPAHGWPQPFEVLQRLADIPLALFIRSPLQPEHWLARLPVLDFFCMVMFGLGLWVFIKNFRLIRTHLMVVALIVGTVLISLGGLVSLSMIIPFVYVAVAAGVGFLLDRWYAVFPRNVIAQGVGIGLVTLAVVVSCWYGLRHYFIAWPAAPATQPIFQLEQPAPSVIIKE